MKAMMGYSVLPINEINAKGVLVLRSLSPVLVPQLGTPSRDSVTAIIFPHNPDPATILKAMIASLLVNRPSLRVFFLDEVRSN